jgi:hypothetical protein
MLSFEGYIPIRIAKLIIGYLNNLISQDEQTELDDWISSSEENVLIFEELIETVDPEEILISPSLINGFDGRLN